MSYNITRRGLVGGALVGGALAATSALTFASPAPAATSETPVPAADLKLNKSIVYAFYDSYRLRDLQSSFARYIDPNCVMHVPGYDRASWLAFDSQLVAAFDDVSITVFDQIAEDDKVATRWQLGGHQTGQFLTYPATGRYASFTATTVDRVTDGKIVEHWADADFTAFLESLGS
jgi:predicted ester cyclase